MSDCGLEVISGGDPTGQLTINGVLLHGPAWKLLDLTPLWMTPTLRGENVLVPGVPGLRPYVRRVTQTSVQLAGVMTGAVDASGDAYADVWAGLEANISYLRANVIDPAGVGYAASLLMPSGATRTALVQPVDIILGASSPRTATYLFTLDLVIPAGVFE